MEEKLQTSSEVCKETQAGFNAGYEREVIAIMITIFLSMQSFE